MHKHNLEHVHFSSLLVNYCYYSYSLRRNISFWQPTIENEYPVLAKLSSIYQNPVPANDGVITIYVHYHSSLLFPSSEYEQEVKNTTSRKCYLFLIQVCINITNRNLYAYYSLLIWPHKSFHVCTFKCFQRIRLRPDGSYM